MNPTKTSLNQSKMSVYLAHLGAALTVACWGTSFICSKILMEDGGFSPTEVYVYRFALAYLLMLTFTFRKIRSNSWSDEFLFMLSGIAAGSLYFITENYALRLTTTANVSLLSSISPIFTTILTAIVFKQAIKLGVMVGSAVAFAGVACIILSSGGNLEFNPDGDLLALSSALSWAVYSVVIKRLTPNYNTFFITRKLFFYGVVSAIPLLLLQNEPMHLHLLFDLGNPQYILNLLFLVIMCSICAYLIWNESMKTLGPVTTNNYLYGQPIVTMIVAFIVFNEKIYMLGYVGAILIIAGLVIADKLEISSRFNKK